MINTNDDDADKEDFFRALDEYRAYFHEPVLINTYLGSNFREGARILREQIASGKPFGHDLPPDAVI